MNFKVESAVQDIVSQDTHGFSIMNGFLQPLDSQRILGPDVDITLIRPDSISADRHSFQQFMGIAFQYTAVHESAGISLVSIAYHIFLAAGRVVGCLPFAAGGKTSSSTASQTGIADFPDNLDRTHFVQNFFQCLIPMAGNIMGDLIRINKPAAPQNILNLFLIERRITQLDDISGRFIPPGVLGHNVFRRRTSLLKMPLQNSYCVFRF